MDCAKIQDIGQLTHDTKTVVLSHICANCIEPKRPIALRRDNGLGCGEICDMVGRILDRAEQSEATA